ncbi:uncharacterized protein LOC144123748 [Amblyomma americanum]
MMQNTIEELHFGEMPEDIIGIPTDTSKPPGFTESSFTTKKEDNDTRDKLLCMFICCLVLLLPLLYCVVWLANYGADTTADTFDTTDELFMRPDSTPSQPPPVSQVPTAPWTQATFPETSEATTPTTTPTTTTSSTASTTPTTSTKTTTTSTTSTTTSTTTTTYKPFDPTYQKRNITGLLCQTGAHEFLSVGMPDSCDFFIVAFATNPARPHPIHPHMALIEISSVSQQRDVMEKMRRATRAALLLLIQRNVLHSSPGGQLGPQAVTRGLMQLLVDTHAHGLALTDQHLRESDLPQILNDAQVLSDEIEPYHGLIRYDMYTGDRQAFRDVLIRIASKPSVTFVYRVSGISRTFTHPYFDTFYSMKLRQENLSGLIDEDVVRPLRALSGGRKSVALSMTLMARRCPMNTLVYGVVQASCVDIPLNISRICSIYPAYLFSERWSLVTRRYNGGDDEGLTEDVFFETSSTFAMKAYLMAKQLINVDPFTFIMERYDLEPQREVQYFDPIRATNVRCKIQPFDYTIRTKDKLLKL